MPAVGQLGTFVRVYRAAKPKGNLTSVQKRQEILQWSWQTKGDLDVR
jgi:hypothetical protein